MLAANIANNKNKIYIITIGIIFLLVLAVIFFYFFGSGSDNKGVNADSASAGTQIKKLNLNELNIGILSNENFTSLEDKIKFGERPRPKKGNNSPFEPK